MSDATALLTAGAAADARVIELARELRRSFEAEITQLEKAIAAAVDVANRLEVVAETVAGMEGAGPMEVMVPLGPCAFVKGVLPANRQLYVKLGDEHVIERDTAQTEQIIKRRLDVARLRVDELREQQRAAGARLKSEVSTLFAQYEDSRVLLETPEGGRLMRIDDDCVEVREPLGNSNRPSAAPARVAAPAREPADGGEAYSANDPVLQLRERALDRMAELEAHAESLGVDELGEAEAAALLDRLIAEDTELREIQRRIALAMGIPEPRLPAAAPTPAAAGAPAAGPARPTATVAAIGAPVRPRVVERAPTAAEADEQLALMRDLQLERERLMPLVAEEMRVLESQYGVDATALASQLFVPESASLQPPSEAYAAAERGLVAEAASAALQAATGEADDEEDAAEVELDSAALRAAAPTQHSPVQSAPVSLFRQKMLAQQKRR